MTSRTGCSTNRNGQQNPAAGPHSASRPSQVKQPPIPILIDWSSPLTYSLAAGKALWGLVHSGNDVWPQEGSHRGSLDADRQDVGSLRCPQGETTYKLVGPQQGQRWPGLTSWSVGDVLRGGGAGVLETPKVRMVTDALSLLAVYHRSKGLMQVDEAFTERQMVNSASAHITNRQIPSITSRFLTVPFIVMVNMIG